LGFKYIARDIDARFSLMLACVIMRFKKPTQLRVYLATDLSKMINYGRPSLRVNFLSTALLAEKRGQDLFIGMRIQNKLFYNRSSVQKKLKIN